jgi:hypothetical protein
MSKTVYRYQFENEVPLDQAEAALIMAIIAAEALHGQAEVRLSMRYLFGDEKHACVIDGDNEVTRQLVLIFTQFLIHEFGEDAFQVTLISKDDPTTDRPAPGNGRPMSGGRGSGGCNGCETNVCAACGKGVKA